MTMNEIKEQTCDIDLTSLSRKKLIQLVIQLQIELESAQNMIEYLNEQLDDIHEREWDEDNPY